MEGQPQKPEFRNNPEIFHPCIKEMNFIFLINAMVSLRSE